MTKQDYLELIKAGQQIEATDGEFPEAYMEALYDYIDESVEFVPALQIGDKVTFDHNGITYTGTVDWLMSDGFVSVMVKGHTRPFLAESHVFKRVD